MIWAQAFGVIMWDFLYSVSVGVVTWLACLAIGYAWHAFWPDRARTVALPRAELAEPAEFAEFAEPRLRFGNASGYGRDGPRARAAAAGGYCRC